MIIALIKQHKTKTHITDVSQYESMQLIQKYRNQKTPKQSSLSVETSHHYLSLSSEEIGKGSTEFKCSPPIRNLKNKRGLWDFVKAYEFNNVSGSHLPSSISKKCLIGGKNRGNFIEATNGISGSLQFGLSIFWTECLKNNMSIHDVHRFLSQKPAKLVGMEGNKGKLKIGYDADLCIWDPDEEWTITKEEALFKHKISPYFGRVVKGRVYATAVRGMFVYDSNHPCLPSESLGTVILKKPMKHSERAIIFQEDE
jgi:allantoinase